MSAVVSEGPERLFERVQELQDRLDDCSDVAVRELADELVSAVVAMYGAGLERIFSSPEGERLASTLSEDPVVATLLLIHDLHPVPLEQRVAEALETVRPYMESHGGNVEFLGLEEGVARLHLRGSCSDCSASTVTLELAIKRALEEAAPDLVGLEVQGVAPQMSGLALPMSDSGLPMATGLSSGEPRAGEASAGEPSAGEPSGIELPVVMAGPEPPAPAPPAWVDLDSVAALGVGALTEVRVGDAELVVANVEGTLLAYRNRCAACGEALHDGALTEGALACPSCQRSFFLPRAGRSLDDEKLQLEPVPLLRERDHVRVALARA
jgi:Fe-S cluster biogenesis protein NfuA/nitrite reductase/ring-hydroxylating ferredoxin subunit